jgi:transcriptional regulator with XRE-family HTH domain
MPNKGKRQAPQEPNQRQRTRVQAAAPSGLAPRGNEPWRKYRVTPDTTFMALDTEMDPERAIGARIAYCRDQLDGLSVEALSRYTKRFDRDGISRTTLARYEAGDFLPGARELRILVDALWVSPAWLLFGQWDRAGASAVANELMAALAAYVDERTGSALPGDARDSVRRTEEDRLALEVAKRQRWLFEARKPGSAGD